MTMNAAVQLVMVLVALHRSHLHSNWCLALAFRMKRQVRTRVDLHQTGLICREIKHHR